MDGSSSNGHPSRSDKRSADQSFGNKPCEPRRGLGIAKLERMRAEEERKENYLKYPFNQEHFSEATVQGTTANGTRGYMSGEFNLPFARPPSTFGAASYVNPSNTEPTTLQLFTDHMEDGCTRSKREGNDRNLSVESTACKNSNNDPQDLDLDLKL